MVVFINSLNTDLCMWLSQISELGPYFRTEGMAIQNKCNEKFVIILLIFFLSLFIQIKYFVPLIGFTPHGLILSGIGKLQEK